MKTFRSSGLFAEQPYYTQAEIEQICVDELQKSDLYPSEPAPIRVDRFIEKRFGVRPSYEDLPAGLLGFTRFGDKGVEEIVVSRALDEEGSQAAERRLRSTLAHEGGGHGLLHAHLFGLGFDLRPLLADGLDAQKPKILCRSDGIAGVAPSQPKKYDGRWWEFQANQAMGAMLLPRKLVAVALESILSVGGLGQRVLQPSRTEEGARLLAEVFDVNAVVARIRIDVLYPQTKSGQLTF
ncbi:MAG: hypothetical protein IVW54_19100 [Candidatus Binataceae bacterium]|nr:hypothetical protein [Candidatus Binataceae bacterium]